MPLLARVSCALGAVFALSACEDVVTSPNTVDPNGPRAAWVRVCAADAGEISASCAPSTSVGRGGSAQLRAVAFDASDVEITRSCNFVWTSNKTSVRVTVNKPATSAIVIANANAAPQSLTVSATCNGATGAITIVIP